MKRNIKTCIQNDETGQQYKYRRDQEDNKNETWTRGMQINIRNVAKNIDQLEILLKEMGNNLDYIALSETWTSKTHPYSLNTKLEGYNIEWSSKNTTKTAEQQSL